MTSRDTQWTVWVQGQASARPRLVVSGGLCGLQGATRVRVEWRQNHAMEEARLKPASGWRRALLGRGACSLAGRAPGRPETRRSARHDVIAQPSADLVTRRLYRRRLTSERRNLDRDYPGVGHCPVELSANGGVMFGRGGGIPDSTPGCAKTHRFRRTPGHPFAGRPRDCGRLDVRQAHHARNWISAGSNSNRGFADTISADRAEYIRRQDMRSRCLG